MKTTPSRSLLVIRSLWLPVTVGCALALAPLGASAQTAQEEKASQPQPTDPTASKAGELNAAAPGGAVKLTSKEALLVNDFGAGNAAEIKRGELAVKNAKSEEVKDFAEKMIKDHTKANEELAVVAKNHNFDFPPAPPAREAKVGEELLNLKGAEFDKEYMGYAVSDHTNDLAQYKKAKSEVTDEKLKEYVDQTEPVVAEHLKMAKEIDAKLTK